MVKKKSIIAFYFGVVLEEVSELPVICFHFETIKRDLLPHNTPKKLLHFLLKTANEEYPRAKSGVPLSFKDITCEQLLEHIEFIIQFLAEQNITLPFVNKSWENISLIRQKW